MNLLPKLPKIFPQGDDQRQLDNSVERELIRREAEIGGQLFGTVPKGRHRQFFCLDEHTWIWYEEWAENGQRQSITTRYEVRPNGILKVQGAGSYQRVSRDEARNLFRATEMYRQRVGTEYQRLLQTT